MADNVGYTPGSGATVAADEIGGVLFQRIKPTFGDDGAAVDVSATNPLPVDLVGVDDAAPLPVYDDQVVQGLAKMLRYLDSPRGFDLAQGRQRGTVVVESGTVTTVTTLTTLTTCSTVTNLSTIDTLQGRLQVLGQNLAAWQSCVRARIS